MPGGSENGVGRRWPSFVGRDGMDRRRLVPRRQIMACLLLIVSRTETARVTYFKHVFGGETADVITDRRVEEGRQRRGRGAAERRREDRGRRDITKDLQTDGRAAGRAE